MVRRGSEAKRENGDEMQGYGLCLDLMERQERAAGLEASTLRGPVIGA